MGEMVIFAAMHAQVVACVLCFASNRKRDLGAFNLAAPSNTQDLLFNQKVAAGVASKGAVSSTISSGGSLSLYDNDIAYANVLARVMSWGGNSGGAADRTRQQGAASSSGPASAEAAASV